ncbi:MAG: DNA translocase FtsK 4TM domain-containing protein [bacterium]
MRKGRRNVRKKEKQPPYKVPVYGVKAGTPWNELAAVFFLAVGIFFLVSLHFPGIAGSAGHALNRSLGDLLGWSAYFLPWCLLLLALELFTLPSPLFMAGLLAALLIFILDASVFFQIFTGRNDAGGLVGQAMTALLKPSLGLAGLYILTLTVALLDLLAITKLSLKDVFESFLIWIKRVMPEKMSSEETSDEEKAPDYSSLYAWQPEDDFEELPLYPDYKNFMKEVPYRGEERPLSQEQVEETVMTPPAVAEQPPVEAMSPSPVDSPLSVESPLTSLIPEDTEQLSFFPVESAPPPKKETRKGSRLPHYTAPNLNIFNVSSEEEKKKKAPEDYSEVLVDALHSFGVDARVINIMRGPTVTRYELQLARGTKISKVKTLSGDIAMVLAALSIRIEAPIPGKSAIGIEVPNLRIDPVHIKGILESKEYKSGSKLTFALGRDITGRPVVGDLAKMPHLLIAGATGSGKTVCLNTILSSLLFRATPLEVQFLIIDPKRVELIAYEGIPHTVDVGEKIELGGHEVRKVVTDPKKATLILKLMTEEMDRRYDEFAQRRSRNIDEFNQECLRLKEMTMARLVIIIDELADLMMLAAREVETSICRLAQLGRACGIHLIVATQRPSVDVITGLIKANIPSRIAFAVASQVDARTVLDRSGAEKLLGKGDMLYLPIDAPEARRLQGAYIDKMEIQSLVSSWEGQEDPPNLVYVVPPLIEQGGTKEAGGDDELLPEAIKIILAKGKASASDLQRMLLVGYPRAGRLMDILYKRGVVGPPDGSKPRKVLLSPEELEQLINRMEKVVR